MTKKIDKLDHVIKQASMEAALACARRVTDELTWRAKECVAEFYDEYEPKYYERWGQLETTPQEITPERDRSNHNIEKYFGGVRITSKDMKELYNISADDVFDLAIGHGYHGLPGYMGAEYKEGIKYKSTIEKMNEYFEIIKQKIPVYLKEEFDKAFSKYSSKLK